ncbi:MAG: flippase-like domain-containing protein [Bacteroidales bacterium]|nr:flippase-like domain-containing protein [Bacteroidales bacterium]
MRRIQKLIKVLLPLAFGIGIVWFILQKVDMQLLFDTIKSGIDWFWVTISWFFALAANVIRGIRWRQQLRTVGVNPSLHVMSISFFGNYGMNLVFPRLGEFWRCNYIAQNNGKPFSTIAGTILSERLCDMLCSASIILLTLVLEGKVLLKFFFDDGSKAEAIEAAGGTMKAETASTVPAWLWVLVVLVVLLIVLWIFRPKLKRMSFYQKFVSIGSNMWKGFLSLKDLPNIWSYIGWSAVIWFFYFLNTLTQFYFFDFTSHLGILACLSVFVMGTMSQLLPIQGGLGAWQAMVIFALLQYGIDNQHAIVFAVVAWSIEQAFVLLMGLYAFVAVAFKKNNPK